MKMDELWSLIDKLSVGADIDWEKRLLLLKIGPFTFSNIPVGFIIAENRHPQIVAELLSEAFVGRRVHWENFDKEYPGPVLASLSELDKTLSAVLENLSDLQSRYGSSVQELVLCWRAAESLCARRINEELPGRLTKIVNDPFEDSEFNLDKYFDAGGPELMRHYLGSFRNEVYPIVRSLIAILPKSSPVRKAAEAKLMIGAANMASNDEYDFDASIAVFAPPEWQTVK